MHVPLFPRPPAVESVATPVSDVPDIATLPRTPDSVVAVSRRRHAVDPRSSSLIFTTGKRHRRLCRNLIHPRIKDTSSLFKDAADVHRRITEFRVRMTERRAQDERDDDDDDVVCGGRCYLNCKSNFNFYI